MMKRMHNDGHTIRVFAIFSAVSAALKVGLISLKYAGLLSAVFLLDFVLLEGIYALLNTTGKVSLNHDFYASLINDRKKKIKVFFILWVLFILFICRVTSHIFLGYTATMFRSVICR
jgi:tetrahydromethanopterin S-methyltransferase subunit C